MNKRQQQASDVNSPRITFTATWLSRIYIDLIDSNLYSGHRIPIPLSGTDNTKHLTCQSSCWFFWEKLMRNLQTEFSPRINYKIKNKAMSCLFMLDCLWRCEGQFNRCGTALTWEVGSVDCQNMNWRNISIFHWFSLTMSTHRVQAHYSVSYYTSNPI